MERTIHNIRVLVVDDSGLARDMIRAMLESSPGITVVGEAANGQEALAAVSQLKPDIVTMDIEMPVMGGIEAIQKIIASHPVPILVVTTQSGVRMAFSAMTAGALDIIEKMDFSTENAESLQRKVRYLARVDIVSFLQMRRASGSQSRITPPDRSVETRPGIIAIAASTGGPQAINTILSHLPATTPLPVVIAQHIADGFAQGMVDWLNSGTPLTVVVAAQGASVLPGHVYVNPPEQLMKVTPQGRIVLEPRAAGQFYNPSCNTLLTSVASSYQQAAIGLIMSGMGSDGVAGMQAISKAGGITIAQDAKSSVIYGMNRLAVETGCIRKTMPLQNIPAELLSLSGGRL